MEYINELNSQQKKALLKTEGPLLILAGAGSGKTKVVTSKIAYLVQEKGVYPSQILAITFTNKAAKEMQNRVANYLNQDVSSMWIGTFHAICVRILRQYIHLIGYERQFSIYDRDDQLTLVKECMRELDINREMYKERNVLSQLLNWKNEGLTPEEVIRQNYSELYYRTVGEIYELYVKKCRENNALDFDDLLIKTVELLESQEEVREYFQARFEYIFVDEYQDTNHIQYLLIKLLAGSKPNLTVVGDNDQSIYKWRGADITNIQDFEKDFPNAEVILLEQNYRSTKPILTAANAVIDYNSNRKDKNLWTERQDGSPVRYKEYRHNSEEEQGVIRKMIQLRDRGFKYSDMVVLYRTNAQSRGFEDQLIREGIPYQVIGGLRFYDRKEVKDILAYLRVIHNPQDDVGVERIINTPKRGIGAATLGQLREYGLEHNLSLYEVIHGLENFEDLHIRGERNVKQFGDLIQLLILKSQHLTLSELMESVIFETGYGEMLKNENTVESRTRLENIEELVSVAVEYEREMENPTLEEFLTGLSLLSDNDTEQSEQGVTLMTLHAAKGLEFPVVFLVGLEERLFPTHRALESDEDIEEERRLCYVGVTRAEEELYLSSSKTRTLFGRTSPAKRSRFIDEMEDVIEIEEVEEPLGSTQYRKERSLDEEKSRRSKREKRLEELRKERREESAALDGSLKVGDKVIHKKWGEGMIVSMTSRDQDHEVVVSFEGKGLRTLMLSMAPIKKVE